MTHRDNVSFVANEVGVTNNPKLIETELTIEGMKICSPRMRIDTPGTNMNMASRLLFQYLATGPRGVRSRFLICDDNFFAAVAWYYDELWKETERGKRKLLDALRQATWIEIIWK